MDPGDRDPSREQLAERVEQLEERNEQHREWLKQMLPDRRGIVKGVGAAIGGGLLGASATGGASGQDSAAGQVGTDSSPVDAKTWNLDVANQVVTDLPMGGNDITDAGAVSTDRATVGIDPERPIITEGPATITVGTDAADIQEAVDMAAVVSAHEVTIDIPDGTYNEDVVISGILGGVVRGGNTTVALNFDGNRTTPGNVVINSIVVSDCEAWINCRGFRLTSDNPYDDENTHFAAYNSQHVSVGDVELRNGTNGIMSYASNVEVAGVDFGATSLTGSGLQAKHQGVAWENGTTPTQGNVGTYAYAPQSGEVYVKTNSSTLTGDSALANSNVNGTVYDYDTHAVIGGSPSANGLGKNAFEFQTTTETANNVAVAGSATETIFDTSGTGNCAVFGGIITGPFPDNAVLTYQDGSTYAIPTGGRADNSAGDSVGTLYIPAAAPVTKLTFDNGSGTEYNYGYMVHRSQV